MSPTEFDLRSALHDGEGGGVDPDRIVRVARARRAQRRNRLLSGAAAVVVTAGIATGIGVLADHRGSPTAGSAKDVGGAATGAASDLPVRASSLPSSASRGAAIGPAPSTVAKCPASYPKLMLPGGGGSGQFGASGPIFAEPPVSLLVCAYGPEDAGDANTPAQAELTGAKATELADSLEGAAAKRSVYPCPQAVDPKQNRLAIIGVTADGTVLRAVTTEVRVPQCNVQVTNGTALRYQWRPPNDLAAVLLALTPRTGSGANTGAPDQPITKTPIR